VAVKFTGSWQKAQNLLGNKHGIATAFKKAVVAEGKILETEIKKTLTSQGESSGESWSPLSRLTLLVRRLRGNASSKALLETGDLRREVDTKEVSEGAFVGVPHGPVSFRGLPFSTIAKMNEEGATFAVKVTPAMQALFFAALREAGVRVNSNSGGSGGSGSPFQQGVWIIRIPPRPFLKPSFEKYSKERDKIQARVSKHLERVVK
jgi:hypothetical protein